MTDRALRGGSSATADLDGPVHYVDFGGSGTPLVLIHGLGGSHLNWMLVASQLAERHHVTAIDLVGFGLTPPGGRSSKIGSQVRMVERFVTEVVGEPAVLVGNSMGGMVAALTAARHPDQVAGLVLVDPALPPRDLGSFTDTGNIRNLALPLLPGIGRRLVDRVRSQTPPEDQVNATMEYIVTDLDRLPVAYIDAAVVMENERRAMEWSVPCFVEATRSIARVLAKPQRFVAELHSIGAPTLLMQGGSDRLVRVTSGRWLAGERPDWTYAELPGVGHVPMIEAPEEFVSLVTTFLDESVETHG